MTRKFSPRESGSIGRNKDDDVSGLHRSPEMEIHGVSANTVGTAPGLGALQAEAAHKQAEAGEDPLVASAAAQGRSLDYQRREGTPQPVARTDWEDVYDEEDGDLTHLPVAQGEDIVGRDKEDHRHGGVARAAEFAGIDRAKKSREAMNEMRSESWHQQTTSDVDTSEPTPVGEAFEALDQEQVAEVNKDAARLEEKFGRDTEMGRAGFAHALARRVGDGQGQFSALMDVQEMIRGLPGVSQSIGSIDPFDQYETTVVGEVTTLWEPKDISQRQVGVLQGDDGETVKLVIWHRSGDKPTLREGDTVRVEDGKINAYKSRGDWQASIAVDSDSEVTRLEHGDGPQVFLGRQMKRADPPAWSAESDTHTWVTKRENCQEHSVAEDGELKVDWDEAETMPVVEESPMITHEQEDREPLEVDHDIEAFLDSLNLGSDDTGGEQCPECGGTHISSYQQQVGSADEGQTSFKQCSDCGHSWRGGYGA